MNSIRTIGVISFCFAVCLSCSFFQEPGDEQNVTALGFESEFYAITVGQSIHVGLTIEPKEAKDEVIVTPLQVVEIKEGTKKTLSVSLMGGNGADNSNFIWSVEDSSVLKIQTAGNIAVLESVRSGVTRITISHPKATYSVDVLAYVLSEGQNAVYITSPQNVVAIKNDGEQKQIIASLVGGSEADKRNFNFQVIEGKEVIELQYNNEIATICAQKAGTAKIRISHIKSEYPIDVLIIAKDPNTEPIIEVDNNIIIITGEETRTVTASIIGSVAEQDYYNFTYSLADDAIADVVQNINRFILLPIKSGATVLTIRNSITTKTRDVLVIVKDQDEDLKGNERYITTSQNVLSLQIGSEETLEMKLIGGNEADRNSFQWLIEDSSIIEAESPDGEVAYARSAVGTVSYEQYTAKAVIKPKSVGITRITLMHPKAVVPASVIVRVYPRGTFETPPVVLRPVTSLLTVLPGESKPVDLKVMSGEQHAVGELSWITREQSVAKAYGTGLQGGVEGVSRGVTRLDVTGQALKEPASCTVVVGTEEELSQMKVIYAEDLYHELEIGQTVYVEIQSMYDYGELDQTYNVQTENKNIVYARTIRNVLSIQGLREGETKVTVTNTGAENQIELTVRVQAPPVTIDKPYYIIAQKDIQGAVVGTPYLFSVTLVGAPEKENASLVWSISDSSICQIETSGTTCRAVGARTGQVTITVKHEKSANEKKIILFFTETVAELSSAVVLYADDYYYLVEKGKEYFLSVHTNATEAEKLNISWSVDDASAVELNDEYDGAYFRAKECGVARITVDHPNAISPVVFIISVTDNANSDPIKNIRLPAIIEMVAGENKTVIAGAKGYSAYELSQLIWRVETGDVIDLSASGTTAYMYAAKPGTAKIKVEQKDIGYRKTIQVVVYGNEEAKKTGFVISAERTYVEIKKGDAIEIPLVCGINGFPEAEIPYIAWSHTELGVIELYPNGLSATVVGKEAGFTDIVVQSTVSVNSVSIRVVVREEELPEAGAYSIALGKEIRVMQTGETQEIRAIVRNSDGVEISDYSGLSWEAENPDVITIGTIGAVCRVQGKKEGQSYISVRHPKAKESTRLLVVVKQNATEKGVYLYTQKEQYLLSVNKSELLSVIPEGINESELSSITWTFPDSALCSYTKVSDTEYLVTAIKAGTLKITVSHPEATTPVTFIVFIAEEEGPPEPRIVTESIISIVKGQSRKTVVDTTLSEEEEEKLVWRSADTAIVEVNGTGASAYLNAVESGVTEVTVDLYQPSRITKTILISVSETEMERNQKKLLNIDKRAYVIEKGEQLNIEAYFAPKNPENPDAAEWHDVYGTGVVNVVDRGRRALITGEKEGVAYLRVSHPECENQIVLLVEVRECVEGGTVVTGDAAYISAEQVFYILSPEDINRLITCSVTASEFYGYSDFIWQNNNPDIISLAASGTSGYVTAIAQSGEATVTVRNPRCANTLTFHFKIGEKFSSGSTEPAYIYVPKNVYNLKAGDNPIIIEPKLMNAGEYDASKFIVTDTGGNVVRYTKNIYEDRLYITVVPINSGHEQLRISHAESEYESTVDILVTETTSEGSSAYLTTTDNLVIIRKGAAKAVSVQLRGYDETNAEAFRWQIDRSDVAYISGSGPTVELYGAGEGTAKITVTHEKCAYPLELVVKVDKQTASNIAPYLTTGVNVIETTVSQSMQTMNVNLVGAQDGSDSGYVWTVTNANVLKVVGNGPSAYYQGLRAGVAQVVVSHPQALNELKIMVIVRNPVENALYLRTEDALMYMKPGSKRNRVTVYLEGGTEQDASGYVWSLYHQSPSSAYVAQNGGAVITLTAGGNEASIDAQNEGTAIIRVTHPRANDPLYIKAYVSQYTNISFGVDTARLTQGEVEFFPIYIPDYMDDASRTVIYSSDNPTVCTVSGTDKVAVLSAKQPGFAVIKAHVESSDSVAEMTVTVDKLTETIKKITTPQTTISMGPLESQKTVTAQLIGEGVKAGDEERLSWSVQNPTILSIFPASGMGKEVKIAPTGVTGNTTITISHPDTTFKKTVYISIEEGDKYFTISKQELSLDTGATTELSVKIEGGSYSDYEKIIWTASKVANSDGTYDEIVRIMGSGQTVSLYGMADGTSEVTAYFNGKVRTCTVRVVSSKYFSFTAKSVKIYPGQTVKIPYNIRPAESAITWLVSGAGQSEQIFSFIENRGEKCVLITGVNEGSSTLTGLANGYTSRLSVTCAYDFSVTAEEYFPTMRPDEKNKVVKYKVYPPNTSIKLTKSIPNVMVDIKAVDPETGEGELIINTKGEIKDGKLEFTQYKSNQVNATGQKLNITLNSIYGDEELIPRFVRYDGYWSNGGDPNWNSPSASNIEVLPIVNNKYVLYLGDGETHYIKFESKYNDSIITASMDDIGEILKLVKIDAKLIEIDGRPAISIKHLEDKVKMDRAGFNYNINWSIVENFYSGYKITEIPDPHYGTVSKYEPSEWVTYTYNYNPISNKGDIPSTTGWSYIESSGASALMIKFQNKKAYDLCAAYSTAHEAQYGAHETQYGVLSKPSPSDTGNSGFNYKLFTPGNYELEIFNKITTPLFQNFKRAYWCDETKLSLKVTRTTRSDMKVFNVSELNTFPFGHQESGYKAYTDYVRMPSIDTAAVNKEVEEDIKIRYTTTTGQKEIKIKLIIQERKCHYLFNPNDKYINSDGLSVFREYEKYGNAVEM
jgi:hypothetical protein